MNATVLDFITFQIKRGGPCPLIYIEADASGQPLYIGIAPRGSLTSAAVWQIVKWNISGTITFIQSSLRNQIWDNRAAISYA